MKNMYIFIIHIHIKGEENVSLCAGLLRQDVLITCVNYHMHYNFYSSIITFK